MKLDFHTLDVFTSQRFGGNPLAVVFGGENLDSGQMQTIAREFNLSETVFVLPPENEKHRAKVRIFTPASELPFAGHPTVGTACLLAGIDAGEQGGDPHDHIIVLEEGVGPVRCVVHLDENEPPHAIFDLPKLPEPHTHMPDIGAIAAAHGLEPSDIGFENHEPTGFNAGIPYLMVPVRDMEAIRRAKLNTAVWHQAFSSDTTGSSYLYTRQCVRHDAQFHTRMFAPDAGIPEDPATGSAVACFAGTIMKFDTPVVGTHSFLIEQGFEMGRPSLITLELEVESANLTGARIGGSSVQVTQGTLTV